MATITDMGIPDVLTGGILQPKLKNRWRVTFSNMGGGVSSQPLSMQCITVTRPKLSWEEVELHRYNSRAWVAGKHNWEPITVTFQDDITNTASRVVQEQSQKQQFLIGTEGQWLASAAEGAAYKFVTVLDMLDGSDITLERWICEGCFLQQVDYGDVDYATSEPVVVTLNIRFDLARQEFGPGGNFNGVATGSPGA